jgi:glycosyltransferase involved in cell wall biosynthesis
MLAAFDQFCQQSVSDIDLVLVGTPLFDHAGAAQWIAGMRNAHRVHGTGRLEGAVLYQAIAGAEGLLLLSHYEGFGIPLVEAFACGVPVLTAQNSALQEIGGEVVFYANNHSVSDMTEQMKLFASDIQRREKCIEGGWHRKEQYTWKKAAEGMWQSILNTISYAQGQVE